MVLKQILQSELWTNSIPVHGLEQCGRLFLHVFGRQPLFMMFPRSSAAAIHLRPRPLYCVSYTRNVQHAICEWSEDCP